MIQHLGTAADVKTKPGKYARVERERRFLLRELPPSLKLSDYHSQIFDNYITDTRLRLRKVRVPQTREWTWKLTQKFAPDPRDFSRTLITNIYLTQHEYELLSVFEGNEIRKNRYPYTHEGWAYTIDVFLGDLRGLILAETEFDTDEAMNLFVAPEFALMDVTHDEMFTGARLVHLTADDLRRELMNRTYNSE